jgi:hypothetical protein
MVRRIADRASGPKGSRPIRSAASFTSSAQVRSAASHVVWYGARKTENSGFVWLRSNPLQRNHPEQSAAIHLATGNIIRRRAYAGSIRLRKSTDIHLGRGERGLHRRRMTVRGATPHFRSGGDHFVSPMTELFDPMTHRFGPTSDLFGP